MEYQVHIQEFWSTKCLHQNMFGEERQSLVSGPQSIYILILPGQEDYRHPNVYIHIPSIPFSPPKSCPLP